MEVEYVPWGRAVALCYRLAEKVLDSGYSPDAVVAVLRGGVVPALIVSDYLGVDEFYAVRVRHWGVGGRRFERPVVSQVPEGLEGMRVLVVDEVADTGLTLRSVVEVLRGRGVLEARTAVLHVKSTAQYRPDYYVEYVEGWRWIFYPWSLIETLYSLASRPGPAGGEGVIGRVRRLVDSFNIREPGVDAILKGVRAYMERRGPR